MPQRNKFPEYRGYISLELTEQDIRNLEESKVTPEEMLAFIHQQCRMGYSFLFSSDLQSKSCRCVMTDVDETRSSAGWKLSGESQSIPDSLIVTMYKHQVRMGSDWKPFCSQTREAKRFR